MRTRKTQMVRGFIVLTVPVMAMLLGGCAFGNRVVALNYTTPAKVSNEGNGKVIYVASIRDVCASKEISVSTKNAAGQTVVAKGKEIGDIRNGYYIKTASVVSTSGDLGPWVTDALTKDLKQRGFGAVQVTGLPPECPLGVSGSLSECYSKVKFFSGQLCTIKAMVSIHKNGIAVSTKEYVGVSKGGVGFVTPAEYEKVFQLAMADLLSKVVKDIAATAI